MRFLLLLAVTLTLATPGLHAQVTVLTGSTAEGRATTLWLAMLRRRLPPFAYDSVAGIVRVRSTGEEGWAALIDRRAATWAAELPRLGTLFPRLGPRPVLIVVGNRGADDAFTHDSLTIGLDLSALLRVYGPANAQENADRLDRFFRHEVVHTMQKRWLVQHPFALQSPQDRALLDIWLEGLGNFFSLSPRWVAGPDGAPAAPTARALATLEPRFASRMASLACADSLSAVRLLADLSAGPFEQKWGALPTALWLQAEKDADSTALQRFVAAGPSGVWQFAERHLSAPLADSLRLSRARAASCTKR